MLLDVETTGCASISYIKQAILSIQMYLQRCRMNLEESVAQIDIPEAEWEWIMSYRIWEANRKVFLYPENYIQPELRKNKTDLFQALESELLQSNITKESVEKAYHNYFAKLDELGKLQIIETYRCFVEKPNDQEPVDTLFIFGKTATDPITYYYRRCINPTVKTSSWIPWSKIDITIHSEHIAPVFAFNKLFLFWIEIVETKNTEMKKSGETKKTSIHKAAIKFTYQTAGQKWMQPQTLTQDIQIIRDAVVQSNAVSSEADSSQQYSSDITSIMKTIYPLYINQQGVDEKILMMYGDIRNSESQYLVEVLSRDLLSKQQKIDLEQKTQQVLHENSTNFQFTLDKKTNVDIEHLDTLTLGKSHHTISAWVYIDQLPSIGKRAWILVLGQKSAGSHHWLINNISNMKSEFGVWNNVNMQLKKLPLEQAVGKWTHIATTYDGSNYTAYINGEKSGDSIPASFDFTNTQLDLVPGKEWIQNTYANDEEFQGKIANVRLLGRSLTAKEIWDSYSPVKNLYGGKLAAISGVKNQPSWWLILDKHNDYYLMLPSHASESPLPISNGIILEKKEKNSIALTYSSDSSNNSEDFSFMQLTNKSLQRLEQELFLGNIDNLLTIDSQLKLQADLLDSELSTAPDEDLMSAFKGASGIYFHEIFFHIPFLIANTLNTNQYFAEAQKWYHYIFNPTSRNSTSPSNFWLLNEGEIETEVKDLVGGRAGNIHLAPRWWPFWIVGNDSMPAIAAAMLYSARFRAEQIEVVMVK